MLSMDRNVSFHILPNYDSQSSSLHVIYAGKKSLLNGIESVIL